MRYRRTAIPAPRPPIAACEASPASWGASLARLLLSDSGWHGCRYARAVVPSSPRRRTMVPAFILWLLGVPRMVVILLGLLECFLPAMPSDRTITGKSRRV